LLTEVVTSHRNWNILALPSCLITFKRDGPQVFEKDSARLKNWKEAFIKIYI
jgi:hypothetical protein